MAFYLYKCSNPECEHSFEGISKMSERDEPKECPKCGKDCNRVFHPGAGMIVFWRDPGDTAASASGPTRGKKYTVKDVADEHNWWPKLGIKRP